MNKPRQSKTFLRSMIVTLIYATTCLLVDWTEPEALWILAGLWALMIVSGFNLVNRHFKNLKYMK